MNLFDRIKSKATQAFQGVGNFIDRDKQMPGVQLAQGGLGNRVGGFFKDAYNARPIAPQNYQNSNLQRNIRGAANYIDAYRQNLTRNLPFTSERQGNLNQNIESVLGQGSTPTAIAQGFNNRAFSPLAQVPQNIGKVFNKKIGGWERAGAGLQVVGGLLPGVDDAVIAGIDAIKGAAAKRDISGIKSGLAGNEYTGLGTAVTGGKEGLLSNVLNAAELPLYLASGIVKPKMADEALSGARNLVGKTVGDKQSLNILDMLSSSKKAGEVVETAAKLPLFLESGMLRPKMADNVLNVAKPPLLLASAKPPLLLASAKPPLLLASAKPPLLLASGMVKPKMADKALSAAKKPSFFKSWRKTKDVSTLDRIRLSRQERFDKSLPKIIYDKLKTNIVDKKNRLLGESIDWGKKYEDIITSLPIKMGGKEDKLIRQFNSGAVNEKQLIEQVGNQKAGQIINAHSILRNMYDEIINFANSRRAKVKLKSIPYKEDFLSQVGNKKSGNLIDSLLGGSKKTGKFSANIFKKQGKAQDFGAIEGMANYLDYAKRAAFTDLVIPKLDKYINMAEKARANTEAVDYIKNYRDTILGVKKIEFGDKVAQVTGGIRSPAVLGNIRSLAAQTFNLPQAIAETNPINFVKGFVSKNAKVAESQSPLLKTMDEKTPMKLLKGFDKLKKPAADLLQIANNFTAKKIWRAFYEQGTSKGTKDAVQYADDLTVQLMGDRRLGELGEFYQSWAGKMFSPFTLENQAGMNVFIKNVGEKKVGKVLGTLFAWHLSNSLIEKYGTGDRPFLDPAKMIADVSEQLTGSERKSPSAVKAAGRVIAEATNLFPALQSPLFTATKIAEAGINSAIIEDENKISTRDLFGTNDPTWMNTAGLYNPFSLAGRNVTGDKKIDVPLNLASKVTPYTNQAARSVQALISQNRGYTESRKGNPMYETPDNLLDKGRAVLFGQNSTKEAREMFDNEFDWGLSSKQGEIIKQIPKADRADYLQRTRKQNISSNELDSILSAGKGNIPTLSLGSQATPAERKELNTQVQSILDAGIAPSADNLKQTFFNNKSITSKSIQERMDIYETIKTAMDNEYYTDEQKQAFVTASGASKENVDYYLLASKDVDVKLQELLPAIDQMDREEMIKHLIIGRKKIGGRQLLTSTMITYLYDKDYISKDEKKMLYALKYDEVGDELYFSKDYKGGSSGGSKKLTYKQAKALFKIDLPEFKELKGLSSLNQIYKTRQISGKGDTLLTSILNAPIKKTRSKDRWF